MSPKRVFKTKTFDRWAKKVIADDLLCIAAREIERGQYEADLGQGVCKKRVALPGKGKRGSARVLVAKRHPKAIVFLVGREKSESGSDFPDAVTESAKVIAQGLQAQSLAQLDALAANGQLKEICHDQEKR